jgi:DHA2 family multidrug resistance protein
MLDKGQEDDWFGSHFILTLAILAAVGLISLVFWEWFHRDPIVDVRLFKNLNFLSSNFMMFVLGIMLFSSLVAMPQFLQTLMGYTAENAGLVLSGGGLVLLFVMPLVGTLTTKIQSRYIIGFGWLMLSFVMYRSTQRLDLDISFTSASILRILQVLPLGFLFVPINLVSYVGMPAEKSGSVAGLVNFMRNIGSSIGTSMVTTIVAQRAQFHQTHLSAYATPGKLNFAAAYQALTARLVVLGLDPTRASRQAAARLYQLLIRQATTLAYIDLYWVLCAGAAVMFLLSFFLRKNDPGGGGEVAVG